MQIWCAARARGAQACKMARPLYPIAKKNLTAVRTTLFFKNSEFGCGKGTEEKDLVN